MNEKIYKTMSSVAAGNIVVGIVTIVAGIAAGVLMIIGGARLIKRKSEMLI